MTLTEQLRILSEGHFHTTVISDIVRELVRTSGIVEGTALVTYQHTTGSVLIMEYETGILIDLQDMLERAAPVAGDYVHHVRQLDVNGAAHLRSILLGVSLTVPIANGDLSLGQYQEIVVLDMDPNRRELRVVIQIDGA